MLLCTAQPVCGWPDQGATSLCSAYSRAVFCVWAFICWRALKTLTELRRDAIAGGVEFPTRCGSVGLGPSRTRHSLIQPTSQQFGEKTLREPMPVEFWWRWLFRCFKMDWRLFSLHVLGGQITISFALSEIIPKIITANDTIKTKWENQHFDKLKVTIMTFTDLKKNSLEILLDKLRLKIILPRL